MWPDLAFGSLGGGKESVYVNVEHIAKGTLFPFGGHLCTHWEYLAAAPASVSTWVRVEDSDRDGFPMWFIPEAEKPAYIPSALVCGGSVGERCEIIACQ